MDQVIRKIKKHYHFIGIGGIGMGAIAEILLQQGENVSGSDLRENQIVAQLRLKGAKIWIGHSSQNIKNPDFLVYSSAISECNLELREAKNRGIVILRRAEMLAILMKDYIGITVAGAHGKTTTTSMIAKLLTDANLSPTTAVGGILTGTSNNASLGSGKYFVSEADESDGSFLCFSPNYSIITNIDFEHVDYYKNWDNIIDAYRRYIKRTELGGVIFGYGEDARLVELLRASNTSFKTYGFTAENDIFAEDVFLGNFTSKFQCVNKDSVLGEVQLSVPGKHNIANALACISLGLNLLIDFDIIRNSLRSYQGVRRRFQLLGKVDDVMVVDDYAHHPTEIKYVLQTARLMHPERLIVIFQPHRYSRLKFLKDDFVQSLMNCDYLIVTDIYAACEEPLEDISSQILCDEIREKVDIPVLYIKKENLMDSLRTIINGGDLLLTLGAGDITDVAHDFFQILSQKVKPVKVFN